MVLRKTNQEKNSLTISLEWEELKVLCKVLSGAPKMTKAEKILLTDLTRDLASVRIESIFNKLCRK